MRPQQRQKLTAYGVAFKSFTEEYLDGAGLFRDAVISILAAIAKQERVRLSERTLAGLDRARKQGRVGGRPRIKRERDKDAKRIRQLREDGQSYTEIAECEARRFRKCKRGDCPHPYFIAGHLKQKFCCEKCAEWGQRQWKTAWWREHGESWRREKRRQQELKGRKNAQKKAK